MQFGALYVLAEVGVDRTGLKLVRIRQCHERIQAVNLDERPPSRSGEHRGLLRSDFRLRTIELDSQPILPAQECESLGASLCGGTYAHISVRTRWTASASASHSVSPALGNRWGGRGLRFAPFAFERSVRSGASSTRLHPGWQVRSRPRLACAAASGRTTWIHVVASNSAPGRRGRTNHRFRRSNPPRAPPCVRRCPWGVTSRSQ
jgi:hypothetical protein